MSATAIQHILEVVEKLPGVTSVQMRDLVPDVPAPTIRSTLAKLSRSGRLIRTPTKRPKGVQHGRPAYAYQINPTPGKLVQPPHRRPAQTKPTEAGLKARLEQAQRELAELQQWKQDAIKRYPDLAVDPEVLKARQIVAECFAGDRVAVEDILAGRQDHAKIMQATLKALEAA